MTRTDYLNDPNAPKPNSIRVAVSAIVQDSTGRLLMIRRTDNDKYAIPGGGQDVGETLTQAVIREVEEETGIHVEVTGLVGLYSNPNHVIAYDDGEVRQEFSICFRAQPIGGELRTSSESKEVHWVALDHVADLDIHPSIRLRIEHGLSNRTEPYFT
ncbi:ADP-ribose pyrophosphatase YjhB (NUDIX family) [Saccharothrix carnea]|uniref:ADP-ribose pyrophosphatase YjhB (NUDIX family) n=1 Tax=Saccharothrix carnea TaxID=1280637 RepID=A0A2P8IE41_SACCR|nr:NUDIX domain-containing protein [Saccharothrix carnea]PSL56723.1 ADP-ribose pyrophosphatase YjhB (NUDIX family) [Saccharothrix carnea]